MGTGADPDASAVSDTSRDARASDRWRAACFVFAAVAIIAGLAWALLGSSLLVVRSVQVNGTHLVTSEQVLGAASIHRGTPLIRINAAAVARRVEQLAPVKSATVSRDWPDKVVITVTERTPTLAVRVGPAFWLVDEYGVTVRQATAQPAGMPLLTAPAPAAGGTLRGNQGVRAAAEVLHDFPARLRGRIVSLGASSAGTVTLRLTRGVTVVWGGTDREAAKARELSILMHGYARYYDVSDPSVAVTRSS